MESLSATKTKGSSSDSGSSSESSSSDSEDSEATKQKKKGHSGKEGKKSHHQALPPGMPQPHIAPLPQVQVMQPTLASIKQQQQQQQPQHPSPMAYMPPQPVAALESSQLLENTFDSLHNFGQPLMHLSHHANDASSPAGPPPPHLGAPQPGNTVSPETHPFLNQHAILPSPGKLQRGFARLQNGPRSC